MFGKSHEKKAGDHSAAALAEATAAAKQRFAEAVEQTHVRDTVVEKAAVAGEKWQHGVDAMAPKVEAAKEAVAPKVEHARESFVEDVLPKVAETIAALTATALAAKESAKAGAEHARETAAIRAQDLVDQAPQGLVDLVPGVDKREKKSGKWLILLGLAAAGAAAYAVLNSKKAKEDPWATPRYDSAGTHRAASSGSTGESKVDAVKEKAAAAGAAVAAKATEVKDAVADKAGEVKAKATDSADTAAMKVENTVDDAQTDPKGNAADAFDSAKDAAGDAWDDVRGKDAGDKLADAGDSAGDAASDAWTDAKNWTEEQADDAKK